MKTSTHVHHALAVLCVLSTMVVGSGIAMHSASASILDRAAQRRQARIQAEPTLRSSAPVEDETSRRSSKSIASVSLRTADIASLYETMEYAVTLRNNLPKTMDYTVMLHVNGEASKESPMTFLGNYGCRPQGGIVSCNVRLRGNERTTLRLPFKVIRCTPGYSATVSISAFNNAIAMSGNEIRGVIYGCSRSDG